MTIATKISVAIAGAALVTLSTFDVVQAQTVILESASLGSTGVFGGFAVNADNFLGWRFQVDSTLQVTEIGGHFFTFTEPNFGNGSIFGAIVPLNTSNALPKGTPFLLEEVLSAITFNPGFPSIDVAVPLSVRLAQGNYALVFGSGLFGASGLGAMPFSNPELPGTTFDSYFSWNGTGWENNGTSNAGVSGIRFFLKGQLVTHTNIPEPSSIFGMLLLSTLCTFSVLRFRHKADNTAISIK
ncbi:PEP-CTERM sorting domain-containing protein [Nostoc favosum]|uniref:PEP-CTERM sorting domain-containing protein n=1 Tax=Nostoc favosum CHAB5714 TaxID=2780399 RepID=A0ABS8I3H0_9NOSO|nr:PEP-CTERM sorting domain-containing protein [Nostoc favosum]MCC5598734.1 PEP-CTERM sorting domain-containing protein [Nostoc favosum CHAB5714]